MRALERHDPRSVGRFRVLARISAGGLAIVYFGRSPSGRTAAVKALHTEFAADPAHRARFHREITTIRAVGGRHSPGLLDADPDARVPWLAMEYLPSLTLRDAAPLPAPAVWTIAAGLVEALASLHGAGIAHLDLKPANVLLTADGPRLTDFGLATPLHNGQAHLDGVPAGSPGYMAPEQSAGGWITPATDIFALGATLSYALTGNPRPPHLHSPAPLPADTRDPNADAARLLALITPCLQVDPAERPRLTDLAPTLTHLAGAPLPPAVTAEIALRTREAQNPPPDPLTTPPPRTLTRRTLLFGAGALTAVVAATAGVIAALPDTPADSAPDPDPSATHPGTPTPQPTPTTSTTPEPPRTLEIYAFGDAKLRSLTMTVNGETLTVRDVKLPYRRLVEIPEWPERTTYRIAYRHGKGQFTYKVIADGREYTSGGSSTTSADIAPDPVEGTI